MITSMTGFASVTREFPLASVGVTLRAVNHRYFDLQIRAPQIVAPFEAGLRAVVQRHVARGRLEMAVSVLMRGASSVSVELNFPLVEALDAAFDRARESGHVSGSLAPGDLLRVPQALAIKEQALELGDAEQGALRLALETATEAATLELQQMRAREGVMLRADLDARLAGLGRAIAEVEAEAARGSESLQARVTRRVEELGPDLVIDPALLAQEVVKLAARSDISEELVRFRAHLAHWAALSAAAEPCGRKLDFLLQELNREINTIGSKGEGAALGALIVHVKAELEKMREQVQNVE
jgi:uncharacterized protein (TIGR00255 family)